MRIFFMRARERYERIHSAMTNRKRAARPRPNCGAQPLEHEAAFVSIPRVRRIFLMVVVLAVAVGFFPLPRTGGQMSEEEKKQKFLKAREEMQTVPEATPGEGEATPKPKPKPKPAP